MIQAVGQNTSGLLLSDPVGQDQKYVSRQLSRSFGERVKIEKSLSSRASQKTNIQTHYQVFFDRLVLPILYQHYYQ